MIDIDGSKLEGGGQILRMSAALSAILRKPVTVRNIRANRKPKPGLRAQHLEGLRIAMRLTGSELDKSYDVGSNLVVLNPGEGRLAAEDTYDVNIATAGSVCLLIQTILPCLLLKSCSSRVTTIRFNGGGTNASNAPQAEYFEMVLIPVLKRWLSDTFPSFNIDFNIINRGVFPAGGAQCKLTVSSILNGSPDGTKAKLPPINLQGRIARPDLTAATLCVRPWAAGRVPLSVAKRIGASCIDHITSMIDIDADALRGWKIDEKPVHAQRCGGDGAGCVASVSSPLGAVFGGTALGEKGKPAEKVGVEAADELLAALASDGCCVDDYLQDQLIIFMALADGTSRISIGNRPLTLHTRTAIHIAQQLLPTAQFNVEMIFVDSSKGNSIVPVEEVSEKCPSDVSCRVIICNGAAIEV